MFSGLKALGHNEEIDKYLTDGPNPERRHRPIVNGFDNCPHYPVMENPSGETTWEKKSAYEIVADIQTGFAMIQQLSVGRFDYLKDAFTIIIPPSRVRCLKKRFPYLGIDVETYIQKGLLASFSCFYYEGVARTLENSGWEGSAEFIVGTKLPEEERVIMYTQYGI